MVTNTGNVVAIALSGLVDAKKDDRNGEDDHGTGRQRPTAKLTGRQRPTAKLLAKLEPLYLWVTYIPCVSQMWAGGWMGGGGWVIDDGLMFTHDENCGFCFNAGDASMAIMSLALKRYPQAQ